MKTGLEAVTEIKDALAAAGMPRTSNYTGGELTGWTEAYGSTGFSIRRQKDGLLCWHMVVSGKPLMQFRGYEDRSNGETYQFHEPVNPEVIYPRVQRVFEQAGLVVESVVKNGHQLMWDDDVEYEVVTNHPDWLEPAQRGRR